MDSGGHDEIKHWAGRHCGNCDLSDLDNNGYGNMTVVTGRRGRGRKRRIVASGSTIDVTCDHGNQFEKLPNLQSLTITCERGQYYNVIPCEPKSCTRPRVGNASIRKARKTIEHGKTITVECLPGYGLPDGTVTIDLTCHLGQFEPEAPETCDDWRCVLSELVHNNYMPLEDEHGRLMTSLASGDTLTATCKTGYHLLDNGTQERLELQCDTGTIQHATPCDLRGCELTDDASNAAVFPEDELMNNTNITPYVNSSTEIESAISQVQWSEPQDFRELRLVIVDSLRMRKTVIFADHKCPCTAKHIPVLNQTEVTLVDLARLKQSLEVKKQQAAQEEFLNQQQQQLLLQEAAQERQQHQHQQQQQQLLQYHSHQYHELMYLLQQHPDEQHQHYLQQLLQQYQKQKHYMRHQQAAEEELLNQKHLQQQQLLQQQQQQQHQQHELLQQDQQQQHPVEQRTALQQLLLQLQQTLQQPHTAEEELLNQQQLQHQHQHHCSLEKGCLYDSMSLYGDDPPTPEQQRLRDELQKSVGDSIVIKLVQFRNWGLTEEAVVFAAHPKTKQDIVKLIAAAREHKVRVRSVGAMHSWSKIHADEDFLVLYMDQLQGEYPGGAKIRISHQGPDQADVMAGVTTGDFMEFQLKEDLYLPANVILQVVTIVGVVAVGCHGVGRNAITPGDYITRMRIFDSDGILRVYTGDDKDMMLAISANFGTFGIIYDVTIQLQPPRNVTVLNKYVPFKSLVNDAAAFKKIVEENWSVELFWFPYNSCPKLSIFGFKCDYDPMADELFLRLINDDTTDAPVVGPWYYTSQEWKDWAAHTALKAASSIYRDFPMETPGLAAVGFNVLKYQYPPNETIKQPLPHAIHYRKYTHLSPVRDIEFAFDLQNNYTKVISVIQTVVDVMLAYNKQGKYPLNIALEMRWMAYGSSYLTPSIIGNPAHGGSGHVFYIEVLSVVDTPHWEEFCKEVASKWMEMDGMPHLAKEWQYIPGIHEHIYKKVSKHVEMFKALLQKSGADPNGIFLNKSLRQLLNM